MSSDPQQRWWPSSPYELIDTGRCPACFTPVTQAVCARCRLNLADPQAAALLDLGKSIVAAEDQRQEVISRIRAASAQAVAPPVTVPQAAAPTGHPAPASAPLSLPVPGAPAPEWAGAVIDQNPGPEPAVSQNVPVTSASAPPPAAPSRQRRLTVPALLIIVGVTLASAAAVGLAWYYSNVLVRALIILAFTAATILVAVRLKRRQLTMTAEGVAVLGGVLLGLDAWAVHANDLFGAGQIRPVIYSGGAVLVLGVLCRVWAAVSRLRAPDFLAVLAAPTGIGLLVAGVLRIDETGALAVGLLSASLGALAHRLPVPLSVAHPESVTERMTLAGVGAGTLAAGTLSGWFALPGSVWAPVWLTLLVLASAGLHIWALRGGSEEEQPLRSLLIPVTATTATVAIATLGLQLAARDGAPFFLLFLMPVLPVAAVVALLHLPRRPQLVALLTAPRLVAAGLATLGVLAALLTAGERAVPLVSAWRLWRSPSFTAVSVDAWFPLAAGAAIAVLLLLLPRERFALIGALRPFLLVPLLLTGAFASGQPGLVVIVAALIGAGAVALIRRGAGRGRPGWLWMSALAAAAGFLAGLTQPALWLGAVLLALVLPVVLGWALRAEGSARAAFAVAPVAVAGFACLWAPGALAAVLTRPAGGLLTTVLLWQWLAVLVLAVALLLPAVRAVRTPLTVSGLTLAGLGLLPFLAGHLRLDWPAGAETVRSVLDAPWPSALRTVLTAALLLLLALRRAERTAMRVAAAALVAPTLAALGAVLLGLADPLHPAPTTTVFTGFDWWMLHEGLAGVVIASVAAAVAVAAALLSRAAGGAARTAADVSAALVALPFAVGTEQSARWASLLAVAVLLGATSAARGWRNPPPATTLSTALQPEADEPQATRPVSLRRYLAWPAFLTASWAWVTGLLQIAPAARFELIVLPVSVGLALFCGVLVWLRRHAEAALAIVLSFALGLAFLALVYSLDAERTPLVVVTLAAAVIAVGLHWSPTRRLWGVATAGATTALLATGIAAIGHLWRDEIAGSWWVLVPVGAAYAAGIGARWREGGRPVFAQFAPPAILVIGTLLVAPFSRDSVLLLVIALVALALVHLASSALARPPFGLASRITSGTSLVVLALLSSARGALTPVEWPTLAAAAALLIGVAAALWRRARAGSPAPRAELGVWIAALVLALAPSILAPEHALRTWLLIGLASLLALATARIRHPFALPTVLTLSGGAMLMGARMLAADAEPPAIAAGAGAIALAALLVRRGTSTPAPAGPASQEATSASPRGLHPATASLAVAILGAVLTSVAVISLTGGRFVPTIIGVIAAAAVGALGALGLRGRPWDALGGVIAIAGGLTATGIIASRFFVAARVEHLAVESFVWPLVAAAVVGVIAGIALLVSESRVVGTSAVIALSLSSVLLALGELFALPVQGPLAAQLTAVLTVSLLTAAAVTGYLWRDSLGPVLLTSAAASGVLFALVALLASGIRPVELLTAPIALGGVVGGLRLLAQQPRVRSWPALGPGLALLTIPSLLHDFGETSLWRLVALGAVAVALIVWGAVRRLQAPLVLGSVVALVHALAQLWPWIRAVYESTEWWLWAGIAGVLLIVLAMRYEKQKVAMRKAFVAVTALR